MSSRGYTFSSGSTVRLLQAMQSEYTFPAEASERRLLIQTWCMDYLCEGHAICHVENMPPEVRRLHTLHVYPPRTPFYERKTDQETLRSYWVILDGDLPFLERCCQNSMGFMQVHDPGRMLEKFFRAAVNHATKGNSGYWGSLNALVDLMGTLESTILERKEGPDDFRFELRKDQVRKATLSERLHTFLEQNYRKKLQLGVMARRLGVSLSTLTHQYPQEMGETITESLIAIRLQQSIPMLLAGLNLKNIADETGFGNEFYYSRRFKKKFGLSPKQWLQNQQRHAQELAGPTSDDTHDD